MALAFDAENEWGEPIGYDVYAMTQRDGRAWRGEMIRSVRGGSHRDGIEAGIAEVSLRTGDPVEEEERVEVGIVDW